MRYQQARSSSAGRAPNPARPVSGAFTLQYRVVYLHPAATALAQPDLVSSLTMSSLPVLVLVDSLSTWYTQRGSKGKSQQTCLMICLYCVLGCQLLEGLVKQLIRKMLRIIPWPQTSKPAVALVSCKMWKLRYFTKIFSLTGYSSVRAQSSVRNQRYSTLISTDCTDSYQVGLWSGKGCP